MSTTNRTAVVLTDRCDLERELLQQLAAANGAAALLAEGTSAEATAELRARLRHAARVAEALADYDLEPSS